MVRPTAAPVVCVVTGLPQDVRQYVGAVADAGWLRRLVTAGTYHEDGPVAGLLGLLDRLLGSRLSQRSADHVEDMVRKALSDKGFHPNVIKTACDFVHDQLSSEMKESRGSP